ncbi:MAG TPA: hypothetical protein VIL44_11830 [Micromonospora sp.]
MPAAAEFGVAIPTVSRHMPIFRRCVEPDDVALLVSKCVRPDRLMSGDFLFLLTQRRLVVTHETKLLHKLRLHLNTELHHLTGVTWNADPRLGTVAFAGTAVDGIRERFLIKVSPAKQVWHVDALFTYAFRSHLRSARVGARPATAAARQPADSSAAHSSGAPAAGSASGSRQEPPTHEFATVGPR